jgi:uncharacterized damage-inducible protein DinB
MLTENLALLFERDILKVKTEISLYEDEKKLWLTAPGISNSAGNLCLHLLGNLQHYIGGILGNSGYIRNRPEEFSNKNIPAKQMMDDLERVAALVSKTLRELPISELEKEYPEKVFEQPMTVEYFLLHLLAHLNYHLGQINYHRRMG